jgi:hypothetical protein
MSLVERQLGACDLHGDRQRDTVQDVVFADGQREADLGIHPCRTIGLQPQGATALRSERISRVGIMRSSGPLDRRCACDEHRTQEERETGY